MDYKDITSKLHKPTQFICAEISVNRRYEHSAGERLARDVQFWVKGIIEGEAKYDEEGRLKTPWLKVRWRGTKETCQTVANSERMHYQMHRSTSRLVQLGLWSVSWRVLPADENGNWVPTVGMIKKALAAIEAS